MDRDNKSKRSSRQASSKLVYGINGGNDGKQDPTDFPTTNKSPGALSGFPDGLLFPTYYSPGGTPHATPRPASPGAHEPAHPPGAGSRSNTQPLPNGVPSHPVTPSQPFRGVGAPQPFSPDPVQRWLGTPESSARYYTRHVSESDPHHGISSIVTGSIGSYRGSGSAATRSIVPYPGAVSTATSSVHRYGDTGHAVLGPAQHPPRSRRPASGSAEGGTRAAEKGSRSGRSDGSRRR